MEEFPIEPGDLSGIMNVRLLPSEKYSLLNQLGNINGLCEKLKVNHLIGLKTENKTDIYLREKKFGKNILPVKQPKSFLALILETFKDKLLIILTVCAFASIVLSMFQSKKCICERKINYTSNLTNQKLKLSNLTKTIDFNDHNDEREINVEWVEGLSILFAVFVIVLVTTFNDWSKEKQFRNLKSKLESEHKINVVRDGRLGEIEVKDLLVGDICALEYGNIIPADGILIESNGIKTDESVLTGESDLVKKSHENPFLFSSTNIMEGTGKMLVIAVGINTQSGMIMSLLNNMDENIGRKSQSILQAKLTKLSIQIGYIGVVVALATVIALAVRYFLSMKIFNVYEFGQKMIEFIITGISVLVVAIPEGLPLAVTLSLAYAVKKMIKDKNLVRHLDACETMGNATAICTDKTGTLTTNRMTVVECFINGVYYETLPDSNEIPRNIKELIYTSLAINSSFESKLEQPNPPEIFSTQLGNKTECSLLGFIEYLGGNYTLIRDQYPTHKLIHIYTFNSKRKYMASCIMHPSKKTSFRLFVKGAAEVILYKCKYILIDNKIIRIEKIDYSYLNDLIISMSSKGLRTICVAYKDMISKDEEVRNTGDEILMESINWDDKENEIIDNLVLILLCAIEDPIRAEVPEAINKCKNAGIGIRMITGDNINTARSIALKCGIIQTNEDLVLESKDFNNLIRDESGAISQEKVDLIWPRLKVLARASPDDKYELVRRIINSKLSKNREVVAVTGDGTNDGPALKMADVGFAMGIQGTDIAKEASDIILTDDNFYSIVKAVMWGRNVYDSISKFLQFQLTVNFVAIIAEFVGVCLGIKPLSGVQMLWINLIMDTLASLALATDPPTEELLFRKPYGRTSALISRTMIRNILFHSIYQLVVLFFLIFYGPQFIMFNSKVKSIDSCDCLKDYEPNEHLTFVFNTFVLMTLFNEINSRKVHGERNVFKGLLHNPLFCTIWLMTLGLQFLIVNYGSYVFSCKPLDLYKWALCFLFAFGELIWGQVVASIPSETLPEKLEMEEDVSKLERFSISQLRKPIGKFKRGKILWWRGYSRLKTEVFF